MLYTVFFIIIALLNLFSWGVLIRAKKPGIGLFESFFPVKIGFYRTDALPFIISGLISLYNLALAIQTFLTAISGSSNIFYVISFSVVIIFEFFILFRITGFIRNKYIESPVLFTVLVVITIFTSIATLLAKDFWLINLVDFLFLLIKEIMCLYIIIKIINALLVERYLPVLVIIFGFAVLFLLLMFSSAPMVSNYTKSFDFAYLSSLVALTIWFGGSLWLRKAWNP